MLCSATRLPFENGSDPGRRRRRRDDGTEFRGLVDESADIFAWRRGSGPILSLGRLIDRNAPHFAAVLAPYQDFAALADQFGAGLPYLLRKLQRHPHGLVVIVEERAGDACRVLRIDQIEVILMHAKPNLPWRGDTFDATRPRFVDDELEASPPALDALEVVVELLSCPGRKT
jgi:hypothetical protein